MTEAQGAAMTEARNAAVERASLQQRRAAAPHGSAWVSANAGSGKTRVLIDRVARLLWAGARPERILCLTYTKAAAAEMTTRLSAQLGGWALADDAALRAELIRLTGERAPDAARMASARRLFAQALETPGGLKIQTIHAFCDAVLRRFPLEAGISPAFSVLDDQMRGLLIARVRDRLAEAAAQGENDAFDRVAAVLGDEGLDALNAEILSNRALFRAPPAPDALCAAFGVDRAALDERPLDALFDGADMVRLHALAVGLSAGGRNDGWIGHPLVEALATDDPDARAEALGRALRKGDGAPRDWAKNPTNSFSDAHPDARPMLAALSARYEAARARADALAAAGRAIALNAYATAFLDAFEDEKRARGALDFDDLVAKAGRLLTEGEMGAWALYKLDGGVDHILVDEAQDTAPDQWRVIRALADEFYAGEGAREGDRTLFVVGDEKQSIYSFQGADVRLFGATRDHVAARMEAAAAPFNALTLETSFRSAPAILRVVDAAFARAPEGLSAAGAPPMHAAAKHDLVGRVDLWPMLPKDDAAPEPPWSDPVDAPAPANPRLVLARALAAEVARWIRTGERLPGGDRAVRAGDIMVLVRRRDILAAELVRALKRHGVDVAGADRLKIGEDLAVRDLLALARFALTPGDDLTLAALLRSPLCGLSGAALEALAAPRAATLWAALRADPAHRTVAARLEAAMAAADFLRPYEFFERALTQEGGRQRLLARLGVEAEDAIDELLAQALAYEDDSAPTLEGFLDWIGRGEIEIKREMDKGAGAVRVMTVHGAKGLEAPVVILPDCAAGKAGRTRAIARLGSPDAPFAAWTMPKDATPPPLTEAAEQAARAARDESRRLLYVAMTRAERWLVVCAAGDPEAKAQAESWHALVRAGMQDAAAVEIDPPEGLTGRALRVQDFGAMAGEGAAADAAGAPPTAPPAASAPRWLFAPAPPPPSALIRRTAASALGEDGAGDDAAPTGGGRDAEMARLRGLAIHALLEHLPGAAPEARPALAARLLARLAPGMDAAALLAEAEAAMALPQAAAVFAPDALAEAALSLTLPSGLRIAGRVDRLAVTPRAVLAVDFKTDAAPPAAPQDAPEAYLRQMAAYRAALGALYPGRAVTLALLWTAAPRFMALPGALLDAALARAAP